MVLPSLGQQLFPGLLAHQPQGVELLIVKFCPPAHACFVNLGEPFRTVMRCVDLRPGTGNGPAPIQGLEPIHHPPEILADRQITTGQFLQHAQAMFSVIHRTELPHVQQFGQLACVDAVALAAFFSKAFFRGLHTTSSVTCGFSRSYNQPAQVPSSNVRCTSPRSPSINCRRVLALVSMTHSITTLPAEFRTAIEMLSLCTSKPIYLVLVIEGVPFL